MGIIIGMMSVKNRRAVILPVIFMVFWGIPGADAATLAAEQTDGSATVTVTSGCNNGCNDVVLGSQIFTSGVSGKLGSIEIFTSGFSTNSLNPDSNNCYLSLYDNDAGTLLARSDNQFIGGACAGDLIFTFMNSSPPLQVGGHYRWDLTFGTQNFTVLTFSGSLTDSVGGAFDRPPGIGRRPTRG